MYKLPTIIAIEMSSYEDSAFPVAVCWSLSNGEMKFTFVAPEAEWLEDLHDQGNLDFDLDQLVYEGHSIKDIFYELQMDLGDEPLFCIDPYSTEQALEKMMEAVDSEYDMQVRPIAELLVDTKPEERELCRQSCIEMFDLNDHHAGDQVRLWMEILTRLKPGLYESEENPETAPPYTMPPIMDVDEREL